ncbi:Retinoblastoma-related protein 1 [Asimina triloba]
MEETKASVASENSDENGAIEARFADLCKTGLSLDESTSNQAMALLKESKHLLLANMSAIGSGTPDEIERFWFSFILYSVKRLGEGNATAEAKQDNEENGFSLCQILRAAKLNVVDFFKELPQFFLKAGHVLSNLYGADWEKRLEVKELQANFVHLTLLSKYYKRAFWEFFSNTGVNSDQASAVASSSGFMSDCHRFGWLLFLALRVHAFSRFKDLVTCTNGLVAVLAILILHVPARYRKFSLRDPQHFVRNSKGVDLIASLCNIYQTSEDDLRKTIEKANNLIVDILKKTPLLALEYQSENLENINTGLLEGGSLESSLATLEKDYDDAIYNKEEIDERMFINEEDSLLGTGSLSGGAMNICGSKRKFDAMASPAKAITSPLSPARSPSASLSNGNLVGTNSKLAPTPVSMAMTTAKWLRTIISPLPPKPSPELQHFLSSCDRDLTNDITNRARIILEAIFPNSFLGERCVASSLHNTNLMDNIWAEQRRMEALKLYYRVLEAICKAEYRILHCSNLTSLLTNERFHRCMLACSAELVLATHKTVTMLFPAVLERTGITAFDLSKVIESFVRHEESLPRELKQHLNSLEERLLESMAWEKGSSLYNSLIVARPALSTEINRLGLLAEPMPSLDAIALHHNIPIGGLPPLPLKRHEISLECNGDAKSPKRIGDYRSVLVERNSFASPVKERLLGFNGLKSKLPPPMQSAFASPARPNPAGGGETCGETGIQVFITKIARLAANRIKNLCERLKLSPQVRENVYCLIQQILNQQTALFFNRHIDQLILCSLYGVAKISQLSLTFKEIIYNYRKQPQCKPQVFRSVFVDWPSTSRSGKQRKGVEHVDIITFYNEVFIPAVKPLLVELGPAGSSPKSTRHPEISGNVDGSPRISPFPSLPDMSPKKVSASHNVYVSPLRSSKLIILFEQMDALISSSSRSYYACVGESTHAYQSPSKDLTVINDRLNGRKLRLNFDDVSLVSDAGLVSDSLVAGSLYPQQNGTSGPSSAAVVVTNGPVKHEQHDP